MKHRATGRPRGRPPSLPYDLAEQILCDLEGRMDRNTMLVRPEIASIARKLNVSRSSVKREIASIRKSGFLELCRIYKRPTDKVCTIMYRILRPILPSTNPHCGSQFPTLRLKNPLVVAQKSPLAAYGLAPFCTDADRAAHIFEHYAKRSECCQCASVTLKSSVECLTQRCREAESAENIPRILEE